MAPMPFALTIVAAAGIAVVLAIDAIIRTTPDLSTAQLALLDETGHLATAVLLVTAVLAGRLGRLGAVGIVLGACLIDVDHVPYTFFGSEVITAGTVRPYSHSLATIAALCAVAALGGRMRPLWIGALAAVLTHLMRDAATGGVPLLWPLSEANVTLPYVAYAAALVAAAAVLPAHVYSARRGRPPAHRPSAGERPRTSTARATGS
jgi:membrane-bound metal-dependent hydrolase YbcI (DUF457 family)